MSGQLENVSGPKLQSFRLAPDGTVESRGVVWTWRVLKLGLAGAAVLSAGMIDPLALQAMLLGSSGVAWIRHRRRGLDLDPAIEMEEAPSTEALARADARDYVMAVQSDAGGLGRSLLLSLAPTYFGIGAAMTAGLIGSNPLALSPWPWLAATGVAAVPAVASWSGTVRRLIRASRLKRRFAGLVADAPTATPVPSTAGGRPRSGGRIA